MLAVAISNGFHHSLRYGIVFTAIVIALFVVLYLFRSFFKN